MVCGACRARLDLLRSPCCHRYLSRERAALRLVRYLAADHQHQHDDHHLLMGFLIQNTQNRDTAALQLKLDELIRAHARARNRLLQLEDLSEEEMYHIKKTFLQLAKSSPLLTKEAKERAD